MRIVYELAPIDYWHGWISEADYLSQLDRNSDTDDADEKLQVRKEYLTIRDQSFTVAKEVGYWEGDISDGPWIAGLPPGPDGWHEFLIGWKQANNGTTFISSPYPLEWLIAEDSKTVTVNTLDEAPGYMLVRCW